MEYRILKNGLPSICSQNESTYGPIRRHFCTLKATKVKQLHYHKCMEIGYCVSGSGSCYTENRIYRYQTGSLQVILPYQPHLSACDKDGKSRWNYVSIDPYMLFTQAGLCNADLVRRLLSEEITASGLFSPEENPELRDLIYRIDQSLQQPQKHQMEYCAALVYQLLICLSNMEGDGVNRQIMPRNDRITYAIDKINQSIHTDADLRIPDLASECNMSESHFRTVFKSVTGSSPKEYLLNIRLNYAAYLLLTTNYSIGAISDMVSFPSVAHFYRKFKQIYGVTPKEYRESEKK